MKTVEFRQVQNFNRSYRNYIFCIGDDEINISFSRRIIEMWVNQNLISDNDSVIRNICTLKIEKMIKLGEPVEDFIFSENFFKNEQGAMNPEGLIDLLKK